MPIIINQGDKHTNSMPDMNQLRDIISQAVSAQL
jgi:hypothetical protein